MGTSLSYAPDTMIILMILIPIFRNANVRDTDSSLDSSITSNLNISLDNKWEPSKSLTLPRKFAATNDSIDKAVDEALCITEPINNNNNYYSLPRPSKQNIKVRTHLFKYAFIFK